MSCRHHIHNFINLCYACNGHILVWSCLLLFAPPLDAQSSETFPGSNERSLSREEPLKILHAEPLYIDLIRDLGARKGEKEWNVAMGITDQTDFDRYETLIEYEFAPIDRLGLEIELPFSFYSDLEGSRNIPGNQLNSVQLAAQYTFLVSEKTATSLAIGYLHEFELIPFRDYGKEDWYKGNVFNPFFIAAKKWGQHFHSLVYTGPEIEKTFDAGTETLWAINTSIHYMIPSTDNFIGIEFNKSIEHGDFDMTIRPQMRVDIAGAFLVGIVTGIPVSRETERFSAFLRLIYEPEDHN